MSRSWFSFGSSFLLELEFGDAGFCRGKKTGEHREKTSTPEQGENQQQTQPTYDTRPESKPGHIGGRRLLSSLHHPFFISTQIHF